MPRLGRGPQRPGLRQWRPGMPEQDSHCPKTVDFRLASRDSVAPLGHLPAAEPPTIAFRSSGGATGRRPGSPPGWERAPDGGKLVEGAPGRGRIASERLRERASLVPGRC